ncbi:MAG: DinB family protein [Acidobacteriota bacterium]|nr:DinB family protein [Acidobacteriota bacterium]
MREFIDRLRDFPARLTAAAQSASDPTRLEKEGGWSVTDVVAHLADLELVYAVRIRTIVAGAGETPLPGLEQDAWVRNVHRREPVNELLEQFAFLRKMNTDLLDRLSEEELSRSGIHPQYGPLTAQGAAERLVRHDEKHLAQLERIKGA